MLVVGAALSACGGRDEAPPDAGEANRSAESVERAFAREVRGDADDATVRSLERFFASLREAIDDDDDERRLRRLFSADAIADRIAARGFVRFDPSTRPRARIVASLERALDIAAAEWASTMGAGAPTLRRIESLDDGRKLVYARFRLRDVGYDSKVRIWLVPAPGDAWRIEDLEDVDSALRLSTSLGTLIGTATESASWIPALRRLNRAYAAAMASEDVVAAVPEVRRLSEALLAEDGVPAEIEILARKMRSVTHQLTGEFEASLAELDAIERLGGDGPMLAMQRGTSKFGLQRYDEALRHFEAYAAELGWDADVHEMVSDAYRYLGRTDDAIEHARRGLDDDPDSWGCLTSLALALPVNRLQELKPRIEAADDPESAQAWVIDVALRSDHPDVARGVLELLEASYPESPYLPGLRARAGSASG